MQDFFSYHFEDTVEMVERKLDELKPFQYDSHYRLLLGDTFVRRISEWERTIRNRKDDPFTLVVCGEFKRGKSSLINAILGEDVVTVNVTTETVSLNRISYGKHSNEVVLSNGQVLSISDEEMQREHLEELKKRTGASIRRMEIRRPIELLKDVTIVDTPGLGDSLEDFSDLVDYSLKQADAVIYVFNTNYPLSRTEQIFLKTAVIPQKYTDLFLVANYSDMMPDQNSYVRMQDLLQQRMEGLLPGRKIWMLSALDERCLQCEEERPNQKLKDLLSKEFSKFREELKLLVTQKKDMVLPDRMQRLFSAMLQDLKGLLDSAETGLQLNEQEAAQEMEKAAKIWEDQNEHQNELQRKIENRISSMQMECSEWMRNLLKKMERELNNLSNSTAEDLTKYYTFYCIDLIQDGMNRCMEYHTEKIYDMLDDISVEIAKALTKSVSDKPYHFRFSLDNQTWTKGDNVSYITSFLGFNLLTMISDGIAGTMRQKEMQNRTPELLQKISEQYRLLEKSVDESIAATYGKLNKTILGQLKEYHESQIQNAKEQVEQTMLVARQDAEQKEEIREVILQIRMLLKDIDTQE